MFVRYIFLNGSLYPEITDCNNPTSILCVANGALNMPYKEGITYASYNLILTVVPSSSALFNAQYAFCAGGGDIYVRSCNGDGKWSKWRSLS